MKRCKEFYYFRNESNDETSVEGEFVIVRLCIEVLDATQSIFAKHPAIFPDDNKKGILTLHSPFLLAFPRAIIMCIASYHVSLKFSLISFYFSYYIFLHCVMTHE